MTAPTGHHDTGVWIDTDGEILGHGCSDGAEDCGVCFQRVEESAGVAEFVDYGTFVDDIEEAAELGDAYVPPADTAEDADDDARECVR
jgi:hypothetical protein